jgi:hypothetical protein
MAHASTRWIHAALIWALQIALVLGQGGGSSYAPSFTECPDDLGLRDASEVCRSEVPPGVRFLRRPLTSQQLGSIAIREGLVEIA